ncbi:HAD family hydrolase [Roseovarius faecimaris]|uniref:phosphoglycolate phosphatase n=1 Tax=Roseovarius faecimaris TaxID=2494550 RepID=A0A6I6ISZ8_9RHOB|nr:HAD family hydrolase [Roseovarius faecimaris]QGX98921.1 HAD family hydrolase [Roseovarius faecimaris]
MSATPIEAMLFDKDGTLFDFHATWSVWAHDAILDLAEGDMDLARHVAREMLYDYEKMEFLPASPFIASTNRQCAEHLAAVLPRTTVDEIEGFLSRSAVSAPLQPAVPLAPFLDELAGQGVVLGVMTNDAELVAHAQLRSAGVADRFAFIAGFDSGHGAKPDPDPLLAFAAVAGVAPSRTVMVGDSTHDLVAGRAAGMLTLGVLTGTALTEDLAAYADAVLPDIGHIPAWMATR